MFVYFSSTWQITIYAFNLIDGWFYTFRLSCFNFVTLMFPMYISWKSFIYPEAVSVLTAAKADSPMIWKIHVTSWETKSLSRTEIDETETSAI